MVSSHDSSKAFALFDWHLQVLMVKTTKNPVFNMILNDFTPLYGIPGRVYFRQAEARQASMEYYKTLMTALYENNSDIKDIVEKIMIKSQLIWKKIQ